MKTYDKYKPSGIDWIGDIPEHWKLKKIKYLVELPDEIISETSFLIAVENIESKTGKIINLDEDKTYQGVINEFQKGDVLFNKLRPSLFSQYFLLSKTLPTSINFRFKPISAQPFQSRLAVK
jgi:type I restriction enzyme S subunit